MDTSPANSLTTLPEFNAGIWSGQVADGRASPWSSSFTNSVSVSQWRFAGTISTTLDLTITDALELAGMNTDVRQIASIWTRMKQSSAFGADVMAALISALYRAAMERKDVAAIVTDVVASATIDPENVDQLMLLCSDIGDRPSAVRMFQAHAGERRSNVFYHALLRVATDTAKPVDMQLAVDVVDEMNRVRCPLTNEAVTMLLHGCARTTPPSQEVALSVFEARMATGEPIGCVMMHKLCAVLEGTMGEAANTAWSFAEQRGNEFFMPVFQAIPGMPVPQRMGSCGKKEEHSLRTVEVYLIDAVNTPHDEYRFVAQREPLTTLVLFSSLRVLCERALDMPSSHPYAQKLAALGKLIVSGHIRVVPLLCELYVNKHSTRVANTPATAEKMYNFAVHVKNSFHINIALLSRDSTLQQQASLKGIPVRASLASAQS